jgi:hypothetical protein
MENLVHDRVRHRLDRRPHFFRGIGNT